MSRSRIGFMCSADYEHHVEGDPEGATIYLSVPHLRAKCRCVDPALPLHCGIYRVEVKFVQCEQGEGEDPAGAATLFELMDESPSEIMKKGGE